MKSTRLDRHNPKNLPAEWFVGLVDEEQKKELEDYLRNSSRAFDQLKFMLQKRYDTRSSGKVTDYDSPSWANRQAHLNGYLEAIEEIFKLLP